MPGLNQPFVKVNQADVNNALPEVTRRAPLTVGYDGPEGIRRVTDTVTRFNLMSPPPMWWVLLFISASGAGVLGLTILLLVTTGVGVWGNNQPVAWGWPIVNFVFWVGIGHAGTLISAILFLFKQDWRTSINRFAEAMTIFAVMCAGIYPALHVGRPWLAYWLFPFPNQMGMWPQFRSPLMWDVFAVSTYFSVSLLFWYMGMVPDLATLRDRARSRIGQFLYGVGALGWNGSSRHWMRFEKAYLLLAALATPLVLSVHSVVSFDFAVSQLPGWHTTIFPPYFVAGAVFGGFAMVLTLAIPCREILGLKGLITRRHLDNMARIMLATGCIVSYAYLTEFFIAYYSGVEWEQFQFQNRPFGNYAWAFWTMMTCNVFVPQLLWFRRIRENLLCLFIISNFANVGMWFERMVIIIVSLTKDFLPSSWGDFWPTPVDVLMFAGTFGFFLMNFLLFLKLLPSIAMAEVKSIMPQGHAHHHSNGHSNGNGNGHGSPHGDTHSTGYASAGN